MENVNKSYNNILKKGMKLSSFMNTNAFINKSNDKINLNSRVTNRTNMYLFKKDTIFSKKGIITFNEKPKSKRNLFFSKTNKDFYSHFPSCLRKSAVIKILEKSNSTTNIKKKESSTQSSGLNNLYNYSARNIPNIKYNFIKNLLSKIPLKKNFRDIDYIIQSPHRGIEKINSSFSKSISHMKNKLNFNKSIFLNNQNNSKDFFQLQKNGKLIGSLSDESIISSKKDKYLENTKKKEVDNPLEEISKLSGVSCSKLRQVIDYSLRHNFKDLNKNEENIKNNMRTKVNKFFLRNKRHTKIYAMINLKSKKELIKNRNENSNSLNDDGSFENVISAKKRNIIRYK